jgi:hypothetical protein
MQERTATGEWIEVVRIEGGTSGGGGASTGGTAATPKTHPTDFTRLTNGSQTISAGAYSVTVSNVGGNNGTVNGTVLKGGETVSFDASEGNKLGAITVVASNTEIVIVVVGEAA